MYGVITIRGKETFSHRYCLVVNGLPVNFLIIISLRSITGCRVNQSDSAQSHLRYSNELARISTTSKHIFLLCMTLMETFDRGHTRIRLGPIITAADVNEPGHVDMLHFILCISYQYYPLLLSTELI